MSMICRSRRLRCDEFEAARDTIGAIKVSLLGIIFYLTGDLSRARRDLVLHVDLGAKARVVAEQRGERKQLSALLQADGDVVLGRVAVDDDTIRLLGVTDVVDADVV